MQTNFNLVNISDFAITKQGNADGDNLLEEGEVFTISVNISTGGFGTGSLTDRDEFTIQIKPPQGATLVINRNVPEKIQKVMVVE